MVDNIIVATFSSVNAAHDAARAIKDLKDAGGTKFKLKSGVIVTKTIKDRCQFLSPTSILFMEPRSAL